jgi:hypothetical protein
MVAVLWCGSASALAPVSALARPFRPGVTAANAWRVKPGMTPERVRAILGRAPALSSAGVSGHVEHSRFELWHSDAATVFVGYTHGRVDWVRFVRSGGQATSRTPSPVTAANAFQKVSVCSPAALVWPRPGRV